MTIAADRLIKQALHWLEKNTNLLSSISSVVTIVSFPLLLLGGWLTWNQIQDYVSRPDAKLEFVYPKEVAVLVVNVSPRIMRNPKYQVGLWNLDIPLEERMHPLPIPVQMGDFVRPGRSWGPNQLIGIPQVKARIREGNTLFGFASVTCPDCIQETSYWLKINHGHGGWYCEATNENEINVPNIMAVLRSGEPLTMLSRLAPEGCRIPIR